MQVSSLKKYDMKSMTYCGEKFIFIALKVKANLIHGPISQNKFVIYTHKFLFFTVIRLMK